MKSGRISGVIKKMVSLLYKWLAKAKLKEERDKEIARIEGELEVLEEQKLEIERMIRELNEEVPN